MGSKMDKHEEISVPSPDGTNPESQSSSLKPDTDHSTSYLSHAGSDDQSHGLLDQLHNLDLKDAQSETKAEDGRQGPKEEEEKSDWNPSGFGSENGSVGDSEASKNDENIRSLYPLRPEAEECAYYMKTGNCKFGWNCKFNHPVRSKSQGTKDWVKEREESSETLGRIECKYYLRTGGCRYGNACRYNHSKAKNSVVPVSELNFLGLPIRLGEKECPYYMRTGSCKFGSNCKFNHPDPTAFGGNDSPSGYGNGVASGSVLPQTTSQANVASWSSSLALNGTAPHVPVIFSPPQGSPSQTPEWNGYQAPAYPLQVNVPPTNPFFMNNGLPETGVYTQYQPQILLEEFPERPSQPECSYFIKTGDCKFRSKCKYHHPKNRTPAPAPCALSDKGLPLRPGQKICMHYSRYGICKFGPACRFDHSTQHPGSSMSQPEPSFMFNGPPATIEATASADGNDSDGWN